MALRFEDAQRGIAQIQSDDGSVVGTGFLIAPGYLLTCAHVVRVVLGRDPIGDESIQVMLLFEESSPRAAQVVFYDFDAEDFGADVALLRLERTSLPQPPISPLKRLDQLDDAELRAFGFPAQGGRILTAVVQGRVQGNWMQIKDPQLTGIEILEGFSGAPVWCQATGAWVGMIVARSVLGVNDKVGFMLPYDLLSSVLLKPRKDALKAILASGQTGLQSQFFAAYEAIRPEKRSLSAIPQTLDEILDELNVAGAGGLEESRLVQFAVCLFLQEALSNPLRQSLKAWIETESSTDFNQLCDAIREQCKLHRNKRAEPVAPCLWINIQLHSDNGGESLYQVKGRFVPDPVQYAKTGQGALKLSTENWKSYADEVDEAEHLDGWSYKQLPALIAAYLDQVGETQVVLKDLTIEIFVPLSLMNEAFELLYISAEDGLGLPEHLGITAARPQVILRSQNRLEMKRSRGSWVEKWKQLDPAQCLSAQSAFSPGSDNLRQLQIDLKTSFGLKLDYSPQTTKQGELAVVLATGTPAALWVRCDPSDLSWAGQLDQQVLVGQLSQVPKNVAAVRSTASCLDENASVADSPELGHRLALLWENPDHVPYKSNFSDKGL